MMMKALNKSGLSTRLYPEKDSLFFKIQGSEEIMKYTAGILFKIVEEHGGSGFEFAKDEKEADDLWANRKYGLWSTQAMEPGSKCWTTDVW
jgi:D-lactate dehydrogenase (cytochrome)